MCVVVDGGGSGAMLQCCKLQDTLLGCVCLDARGEMRVASDVAADNDSLRVPKHAARRPSQVTLAVTAWLSQYYIEVPG